MIALTVTVLIIAIVAVTYVFLVMPRVTDGADMDLQSTDYAYGGLWDRQVLKNSPKAFEDAKALGYGIAFSLTTDKEPSISAKGAPSLTELLALVDGHVPLLIEIPPSPHTNKLCKQLCLILDGYSGAFSILSSDLRVLSFFKKYRPRYARGQIVSCRKKAEHLGFRAEFLSFMKRHLFTNVITRPDFIVTDGSLMNEPAFLLATKLFRRRGFIKGVKNARQYAVCRDHSLYALFERIRPR